MNTLILTRAFNGEEVKAEVEYSGAVVKKVSFAGVPTCFSPNRAVRDFMLREAQRELMEAVR